MWGGRPRTLQKPDFPTLFNNGLAQTDPEKQRKSRKSFYGIENLRSASLCLYVHACVAAGGATGSGEEPLRILGSDLHSAATEYLVYPPARRAICYTALGSDVVSVCPARRAIYSTASTIGYIFNKHKEGVLRHTAFP